MQQADQIVVDLGCAPLLRCGIQRYLGRSALLSRDLLADLRDDPGVLKSASALVVGARDVGGVPATMLIERLRTALPHIGIFVVMRSRLELDAWHLRFSRAGADESYALSRESDRRNFSEQVPSRLFAPPPEIPLRFLWELWGSATVRTEAMHCVRNAYRASQKGRSAAVFGTHEKTFRTHLTTAGMPTPLALFRFGLQLHAAELVARGVRPTSALATRLGYGTGMQLSEARRRVRRALQDWPELVGLIP